MKIFWCWQSDTPGKTGRHFIRDALKDAIAALRQAEEIEEPLERDLRKALHLDHDRKDISGTPELARTIFGKIDQAAVFVADVTTVAELPARPDGDGEAADKKLINPNVAIEYGYAVKVVGDELILLVQNTFYGGREGLPFDLKHKAGPIQYRLAMDATKAQIAAEKARLTGILTEALRACMATLARSTPRAQAPGFPETPFTANRASYWEPGEVLARIGEHHPLRPGHGSEDNDVTEYRIGEPRALYVRLIPTKALPEPLKFAKLMSIVDRRVVRVLTRTFNSSMPFRNRYGALLFEPHGSNPTPLAMTQLFRNGEIWSVTREFWQPVHGVDVLAMGNVEHRVRDALLNFPEVAAAELGINPPYTIEVGAVGLKDTRLSLPNLNHFVNQVSDVVHDDDCHIRVVLNDVSPAVASKVATDFARSLYELAAVDY